MKIAIVGGTHGNEPVGIEVIRHLDRNPPLSCKHEFDTFWANPKAYELQRRFVDCDLNRTFGRNGRAHGYEKTRSQELAQQIEGHYDFVLDLHTTTSNMGITAILTQTDPTTRRAAAYLKERHPELILIETIRTDDDCCYVCNMAPSGFIFEVGPVANNVIRYDLFMKVYEMVCDLLAWDFEGDIDLAQVEHYKSYSDVKVPEGYYVHPSRENKDFVPINPGEPLFINVENDVIAHEGDEVVWPMFINEAAYQNDRLGMTLSHKRIGFTDK
jgi:succinylglutamate desuccinylase